MRAVHKHRLPPVAPPLHRLGSRVNYLHLTCVYPAGGTLTSSQADLIYQLHDERAAALWGYWVRGHWVRLTYGDRSRAQDVVQEMLLRA